MLWRNEHFPSSNQLVRLFHRLVVLLLSVQQGLDLQQGQATGVLDGDDREEGSEHREAREQHEDKALTEHEDEIGEEVRGQESEPFGDEGDDCRRRRLCFAWKEFAE